MADLRTSALVDLDQMQKVLEDFTEATGFATVAVDTRGLPVTTPCGFTDFCKKIREDPRLNKLCHGCDAHGGLQSLINGEPHIYRCHAGLVDFSIPVTAGDMYVGAILCGQVRVPSSEQPDYLTADSSWPRDPELVALQEQVQIVPRRRVSAAAETLLGLLHNDVDGLAPRSSRSQALPRSERLEVSGPTIRQLLPVVPAVHPAASSPEMSLMDMMTPETLTSPRPGVQAIDRASGQPSATRTVPAASRLRRAPASSLVWPSRLSPVDEHRDERSEDHTRLSAVDEHRDGRSEDPTHTAVVKVGNVQVLGASPLLAEALAGEDLTTAVDEVTRLLNLAYEAGGDRRDRIVAIEELLIQIAAEDAPRALAAVSQSVQRQRVRNATYDSRYQSQLHIESLLFLILDELVRSRPQRRLEIVDLLNAISRFPERALSLSTAARMMHMSPGHLSKLFKSATGCTFVSYVTARRISRARLMLASTQMSVKKVATELGFNQVNYFSRVFRAYTGASPSDYRRQCSSHDGRPAGVYVSTHNKPLLRA